MVKLSAEEQEEFVRRSPNIFTPVKGAWGRQGATNVNLAVATTGILRDALTAAFRKTASKRLSQDQIARPEGRRAGSAAPYRRRRC